MRIEWTVKADKNLNDIAQFIANDNPKAAQQILRKIHDSVSLLSENPNLGYSGRLYGTRELVVPNTHFIIPYRVRPRLKKIEILRIFHTSRIVPERW